MGIANYTMLLDAVKSREASLALSVEEIKSFDGNVQVEPGTTRNAAQLQQELDALVNTQVCGDNFLFCWLGNTRKKTNLHLNSKLDMSYIRDFLPFYYID